MSTAKHLIVFRIYGELLPRVSPSQIVLALPVHISSLCSGDRGFPQYKVIEGAVLTSESENNLDCGITFQTDSILQKFMIRFEKLALDCNDHLIIFDGGHAIGKSKVR